MTAGDEAFWTRARRARDELAGRLSDHPDVALIDLGYDLRQSAPTPRVALRVHVRRSVPRSALQLPDAVDGIPVCLVRADYRE
jgi:hypothetical protein